MSFQEIRSESLGEEREGKNPLTSIEKKGNFKFQCERCKLFFQNTHYFMKGTEICSHINCMAPYKCEKCDKLFTYKETWEDHIKNVCHLNSLYVYVQLEDRQIPVTRVDTSKNISKNEEMPKENEDIKNASV